MRPDKKAIRDEVWSDERVREFLKRQPYESADDDDFVLLLYAYRAMRVEDFERFVAFFVADGHRLDARNEDGETFADYVASHRHARDFIAVIERAREALKA